MDTTAIEFNVPTRQAEDVTWVIVVMSNQTYHINDSGYADDSGRN